MFDYYKKTDEKYKLYRTFRMIITDKRFFTLSSDAKILYELMVDRTMVSIENGWFDDNERVFIIYTLDEMSQKFNCSKTTCTKVMNELQKIGLIEKKRRGQGKPSIIYVKNIMTVESAQQVENVSDSNREWNTMPFVEYENLSFKNDNNTYSRNENFNNQELHNLAFTPLKERENDNICDSKITEIESLKSQKLVCNNNNINNNTCINNIYPINQSNHQSRDGRIDRTFIQELKENIDYDDCCVMYKRSEVDNVINLAYDLVATSDDIIRIGNKSYPRAYVRQILLTLNSSKVGFLIEKMEKIGTDGNIRNPKKYLQSCIFSTALNYDFEWKEFFNRTYYGGVITGNG